MILTRRHPHTYDVAFYVPAVGPLLARNAVGPAGGAETQAFLVSRALAARGVRVCVCTFDVPGADIPATVDGVDVVLRQPYARRRGPIGRIGEAVALLRDLGSIDAGVLVTRTAGYHVGLTALAARLRRRRFVYSSAHVLDFDFARLAPTLRDRLIYRLGISLADAIVVQNKEQATLCRARFGRAGVVVPSIAEAGSSRGDMRDAFLWVGRAVWYKGPLELVELARAVPEARFRMVCVPGPAGEDLSVELERAARSVANLELLPARPRADLLELVGNAVAVVNTSHFEGMPNVSLEGWARGVPTLALRHDPDGVIGRRGLGAFADGSFEHFVTEARALWANRSNQDALARRCREYIAEEHSEARAAEAWAEVLESRSSTYDVGFYVPSIAPLVTPGSATPPTGGAELQVLRIARGLSARGLRVAVSAYEVPGSNGTSFFDGVEIIRREPHRGGAGPLSALREALATLRATADLDADAIVTRIAGSHVGLAALGAKAKRRRFVYSSAHLADFDFARLNPRLRDRLLHGLGLRLADEIVAQTDEQQRLCNGNLGLKTRLIRSITDCPPAQTQSPAFFLWVGRAVWYKRPLDYVALAEAVPEAQFRIVAVPVPPHEGDLSGEVEDAAGRVPNLELLGPRPHDELMELVGSAVAIVNTSDAEGMSNVMLEAWARGIPTLALEHDPDGVIERFGLGTFAAGSPDALASAARELWRSRGDRAEVAERCRGYIRRYHSASSAIDDWMQVVAPGGQAVRR
jgi:glycosyltransferase involved in cell wall biosynthesis